MSSAAFAALTMFSTLDSGPEFGTRTPKEILFITFSLNSGGHDGGTAGAINHGDGDPVNVVSSAQSNITRRLLGYALVPQQRRTA